MHNKSNIGYLPWFIWGLAAFYFFADYSARVSPSVMLTDLQQAFQVSAVGLGSLSAYFYYPYVAMQIPVGLLVDRYNVRYVLTIMSFLTALACFIFGSAESLLMAQIGRFLIGFSAAFAFVSALRLAAIWFPPARLGLLAGLTQALGMAGAFAGAYPVSYGVSTIGWRNTMFVMMMIFIVTAILIFLVVRDRKKASSTEEPRTYTSFASLIFILKNPQTWFNAIFAGMIYAPTAVLGELWGGVFFQFGHGFTYHQASFAVSCIFIGWVFGGPIAGWLSDLIGKRRPLMFVSAISGIVLISVIIFVPNLAPWLVYTLLFIHGFTNIGVSIA